MSLFVLMPMADLEINLNDSNVKRFSDTQISFEDAYVDTNDDPTRRY